jgi:hypothetical protein
MGREGQQHENCNGSPTNTFFRAKHQTVKERAGQNDNRSWKHGQDRSNQTDRKQDNREQPPEEFHLTEP